MYYEYILRGAFIAALKQQFEFCTFDSKSFIFSILFQDTGRTRGGYVKSIVATPRVSFVNTHSSTENIQLSIQVPHQMSSYRKSPRVSGEFEETTKEFFPPMRLIGENR